MNLLGTDDTTMTSETGIKKELIIDSEEDNENENKIMRTETGSNLRLRLEFSSLMKNKPEGIIDINLLNDNIFTWRVVLQNLQPLNDSICIFDMSFTENFPYEAPKVKFLFLMYHPNICPKTNELCNDGKWCVVYDLRIFLIALRSLLSYPHVSANDNENPANLEAFQMWEQDKESYGTILKSLCQEETPFQWQEDFDRDEALKLQEQYEEIEK